MTHAEKKALGLILSAADRKEAEEIAAEIRDNVEALTSRTRTYEEFGARASAAWVRADKSPAINAAVNQIITHGHVGECTCHRISAADSLEQFRRYGETGIARGGRLWLRTCN